MSTIAVGRQRDPGRLHPPPPIGPWGHVMRWGFSSLGLLGAVAMVALAAVAAPEVEVIPAMFWPWRLALDVVLTVAAALLIVRRRRRPVLVACLVLLMSLASFGASCFVPWAFVSLCTRRRWREVLPVALLAVTCFAVEPWLPWGTMVDPSLGAQHVGQSPTDIAINVALMVVLSGLWLAAMAGFGFYVGARRDLVASLTERAEAAERQQQLQVEAGKAGERARIAREMHDVLAHRISLVSMHAGVLAFRDDLDAAQTRQIAGIISENAHASLVELRQVLSTLRQDTDGSGVAERPQPTLSDLGQLVVEARDAGTPVVVRHQLADTAAVPPTLGRHAYRIVQEALTNARKHAVGAPVTVSLTGRAGKGLSIEVRNALTHRTGIPGAGLGLVGLAERARLLGGSFEAGPQEGDFVVRAWLPWQK